MAQAAIAEPDAKESTARVGLDKAHAALRQCYQDISLLTVAVGEGKRAESLPSDHLAMCRAFRVGGDPHRGPNVHRSPVAVGTTLEGAREVAAQEMTRAVLRQAMSGFFQARATASPDSMQSRMAAHMTQSLTAILPTATAEDVAVDCRLVPDQPTEESSWVLTVEEEVLSECGWDPQRGQTKPSLSAPALLAVPEARERLCHESLWVDGMQTTLAAMQVATPEMVPLLAGNGTGLVLKCLNACQQMHLSSRDTAERLDWGVHADHGSEEAVWQGLGTALEESDIPRLIALNPQGAANPGAAAHFKQFAEMMSREQAFSEENLAQTKELLRQAFDAIAIDGLWFIVVKKRE